MDDRATGDDLHAFAEACARVERRLTEAGLPGYAAEHRLVAALARRALAAGDGQEAGLALETVFREARERVPAFQRPLIDLLEREWLERQLAKSRRKGELWDEVFATEPAREHRYATVDHGLVHALTATLAGSGRALVVHGGTSISRTDLATLAAQGVARVNFGSAVYTDYLDALGAHLPGDLAPADNPPVGDGTWKHVRRMSYLAEATRDWRSWTHAPPSFVDTFVSRLERRYAARSASVRPERPWEAAVESLRADHRTPRPREGHLPGGRAPRRGALRGGVGGARHHGVAGREGARVPGEGHRGTGRARRAGG
ncbi:hypothetical protein ACFQVA_25210 [Actinomadura keratinilytica]